jgi:quinol---cytochrome c reductase iron-sulfur subunit, bacillus type
MGPRRAAAAEPEPVAEPAIDGDEPERYPRNQFLELTTLGLGGLIGAMVVLPVLGFAVVPPFTGVDLPDVDLGPLDEYPEGEWREVTFLLDPTAGEVSRRTVFARYNGEKDGLPSMTLISNRCVHLGCPAQAGGPREEQAAKTVKTPHAEIVLTPIQPAGYSCPCHGGAYDTEGNRIAGPPVRALDRYKYSIINNRLKLIETYSVAHTDGEGKDARIEAYGRQGPGEHVDGLEGWLYPIQAQDLEG